VDLKTAELEKGLKSQSEDGDLTRWQSVDSDTSVSDYQTKTVLYNN